MRHAWRRALRLAAGTPFLFAAVCVAYARCGTDSFFVQHWSYAEPVMTTRTHRWALWQRSLTADERACLQVWLDAMSLTSPSAALFSPQFVLQDTLYFLCGLGEWCDAVRMLAKLAVVHTTPYCIEIRREQQDGVVFLHGRLETEVTLRLPFTNAACHLLFPSVVSLQLERAHRSTRIAAAEHRWFGGPLVSQQSASLRSPWGDVGDLGRRLNSFVLSCVVRAGDRVSARLHASG
ncbi:hypothetical protein DQ04_05701030 [Trypanosoma grayi]|uniref:hypothetical protein n=1 Tax=Trypanosoma grayi TaxID=71804 RepID=UPI0004F4BC2C|nr:hypothetical protein DQ04_05701030 [Trypanosoma grayi]KEG09160.1 hypothetical protein DQ04_05701030 [Trypanosoma grayi]